MKRIFRFLESIGIGSIECILLLTAPWWGGCLSSPLSLTIPESPEIYQETIETKGFWPSKKLVLLPIQGEIGGRSSFLGGKKTSPEYVERILKVVQKDPAVQALLLQIDSPGGEVKACDEIYSLLVNFSKSTGVPIYAIITGLGTSGAYYIACAARGIYAEPTAITGSIGVILRLPMWGELAKKIGYTETIIKNAPYKDMGNPLLPLKEEEQKCLQDVIDYLGNRFLNIVKESRKNQLKADLEKIGSGLIFTAPQGMELGLIDEVLYPKEAVDRVTKRLGMESYRVVLYTEKIHLSSPSYYSVHPSWSTYLDKMLSSWKDSSPVFEYRWIP